MVNDLRFYAWRRSGLYRDLDLQDGGGALRNEGRVMTAVPLTLADRDHPSDRVDAEVKCVVAGPRDVLGLHPSAVVGMVPPPGSAGFETTKCAYVELGAPDLPWRYTPERAGDTSAHLPIAAHTKMRLRPWIVLVVGTVEEMTLGARTTITLHPDVTRAHALADSARWAHVQEPLLDDGRRAVARLLSPRQLTPDREYLAAIVPAFDEQGEPRWEPGASPTLPCYHYWRFRTSAAQGDFQDLAMRLKPGMAAATLGRAPLQYGRVSPAAMLEVRGALAPIGGVDAPLPAAVRDDVQGLMAPLRDPRGRPIVSLPRYGTPWVADPATVTWGATVNLDPRHRGVAGLGLWIGIEVQQQLMDAVADQVGAVDAAAQRVAQAAFGVTLSRSLWARRLPADRAQRLLLYGPSLRRMVTNNGPVLQAIAGGDRPLPPRLFSSAARRVLRAGPARTALAARNATAPAALLAAANRCVAPVRSAPGLPHADLAARALGRDPLEVVVRAALADGGPHPDAALDRLARAAADPAWEGLLAPLVAAARAATAQGRFSYQRVIDVLIAVEQGDREAVARLRDRFDDPRAEPEAPSLLNFARALPTSPPNRPCRPVDLNRLEAVLTAAIDPTVAEPLVQRRVRDTITGLDDQQLAPVEVCPGVDFPVWTVLRDRAPDWLLPGVGELKDDEVVALESNPTFVDAFLLGLNAQVLTELRWRNVPVGTGCTPMRMFWGQIDADRNAHRPDVQGVREWPATSPLGDASHQPPPPVGTDLVLVFRSELFRRYPKTVVYIAPAPVDTGGTPQWEADAPFGGDRRLPTFQGAIGEDVVFFRFDLAPRDARRWWVVLEEAPMGFQFRSNVVTAAEDGAEFAHAAFANPLRVLIRGDCLVPDT